MEALRLPRRNGSPTLVSIGLCLCTAFTSHAQGVHDFAGAPANACGANDATNLTLCGAFAGMATLRNACNGETLPQRDWGILRLDPRTATSSRRRRSRTWKRITDSVTSAAVQLIQRIMSAAASARQKCRKESTATAAERAAMTSGQYLRYAIATTPSVREILTAPTNAATQLPAGTWPERRQARELMARVRSMPPRCCSATQSQPHCPDPTVPTPS